jgi:DNA polymerase-3 subunit alpha
MAIIPLHVETSYSMRGSNITVDALIEKAKDFQLDTLAIADHRMYAVVSFYNACKASNIKPIIGLHIVMEGIILGQLNHVYLYVKTNQGYQNLLQLASLYALNDVVRLEELKRYADGLIVIIDSDDSEVLNLFKKDNTNGLMEIKSFLQKLDTDVYVALSQNNDLSTYLYKHFKTTILKHVFYLNDGDQDVYQTLQKIFLNKSEQLDQLSHFDPVSNIDDIDKMYPDALKHLKEIVASCHVDIDFNSLHLPTYPHPKHSSKVHLNALVHAGLKKRLKDIPKGKHSQYYERIKYELNVIDQMGYNDYFLIVYDFVKYAKQKGVLVGPGRGSAAASLVSYCLGITSIDSIEYDLVFERFLNPERSTLPDIDIDLPDDKRDDVIGYVRDLYGLNRVASICTFGTFKIKSAIRDTARIHELSSVLINQIVALSDGHESVESMLANAPKIRTIIEQHPKVKHVLEIASKVENLPRHVSTHAAGIIVSDDVLTNQTALQPGLLDMMQTQYEAKDLESLGLLKIDFLGLRNLTIIKNTLALIKEDLGQEINMYQVPLDDKKTIELLNKADTVGIFQLESDGMTQLIEQMKMRSFDDIVTVLALYRPGPMERIPEYLRRRFKKEAVDFIHPSLKDILEPTEGIIIYQEQIIKIANVFAGYSLGEADLLRRAVSKKKLDLLEQERAHFIEKAKEMGRTREVSEEIYDYIVKFANYGFNKAHSVAYARVSYWMAYLKANYPTYFIGVLMSSVIGSERLLKSYIFEANKLNVPVLKPSVNVSKEGFRPTVDGLVYPLLGIKNVGRNAVNAILEERENGLFKTFVDFISRTAKLINKRVIESLIYAGACDDFGHTRQAMIKQYQDVLSFMEYGAFIDNNEFVLQPFDEFTIDALIEWEKSVIGFNLFMHPVRLYQETIDKHLLKKPADITDKDLKQTIRLIGMVSRVREIQTKKQSTMAFLTIEDEIRQLDAVVFPSVYKQVVSLLQKGKVFLFLGRVDLRRDKLQYIVEKVHLMEK